jgi:multisubunit Na+/H+ antiporter MnhC subunit
MSDPRQLVRGLLVAVVASLAATAFVARSAYRHYEDPPTYGDKHIGFRVASQ